MCAIRCEQQVVICPTSKDAFNLDDRRHRQQNCLPGCLPADNAAFRNRIFRSTAFGQRQQTVTSGEGNIFDERACSPRFNARLRITYRSQFACAATHSHFGENDETGNLRQGIKVQLFISVLALSTTAAVAQTRPAPNAPLLDAVCLVGGGPVWGEMDPDPNIRYSLLRQYGGFLTVYMGKVRPGASRCEPAR